MADLCPAQEIPRLEVLNMHCMMQKWLKYQELLVHLTGFFCTRKYTNVLFWAKMVHVSGMFIYPAAHLSGVHCITTMHAHTSGNNMHGAK